MMVRIPAIEVVAQACLGCQDGLWPERAAVRMALVRLFAAMECAVNEVDSAIDHAIDLGLVIERQERLEVP